MKIKASDISFALPSRNIQLAETIGRIQQDLFIIQAELAGAEKTIVEKKVKWLEEIIDGIEKMLPPVKTFFVSGGTELATLFDTARTIVRRAERRVVGIVDEGKIVIGKDTLAYLNRLSSVLYAFARATNFTAGIAEEVPRYD